MFRVILATTYDLSTTHSLDYDELIVTVIILHTVLSFMCHVLTTFHLIE